MQVIIGSDANGFELKETIKNYLIENGFNFIDVSESAHPDFVESSLAVCMEVLDRDDRLGILFDGYGAGSFIACTKVKGMVVAEVSDERSAYMTREHNNARVITLGQEIVGKELARNIVKEFLTSDYAGGRHQIRVDMLNKMC